MGKSQTPCEPKPRTVGVIDASSNRDAIRQTLDHIILGCFLATTVVITTATAWRCCSCWRGAERRYHASDRCPLRTTRCRWSMAGAARQGELERLASWSSSGCNRPPIGQSISFSARRWIPQPYARTTSWEEWKAATSAKMSRCLSRCKAKCFTPHASSRHASESMMSYPSAKALRNQRELDIQN